MRKSCWDVDHGFTCRAPWVEILSGREENRGRSLSGLDAGVVHRRRRLEGRRERLVHQAEDQTGPIRLLGLEVTTLEL